ncbi:CDP-alcohol phosphatidyltransferase family protein [Ktedonosporobacter rubrisoli]|uniref:CDP-alcohol phosphatidyltransferase family protein n=1 Tax=Ktedonosporobacter rubrisoli TaxID=2509675 RepID=A0A4P6JXT2_KTERU|nr:CDP-alcohol phosphatidyltransferase family protein [Ktedonosporobacter rubrisoli]QBD80474.1 CDP-alcohol phosphatidyltransferase family protein [Ktedonosporobacter rubrisoli]
MFSRRIQQQARHLVTMIIQPLARLGVTPNMLTGIGLLLSILTAIVIAQGSLFVGGLLVLFAGIFDMFDGAMARVRNAATIFGAFLDSTLDRYSESIILLGLLLYTLQRPGLQDALWPAPNEQTWMIIFIFVALAGSLMVSYTKARAEGLGIECKTGLLARPERVIILAIGLLTNTGIWALALLAVFSNVTAVERMIAVWRTTSQLAAASEQPSAQFIDQNDTSSDNRHSPAKTGKNEPRDSDVQSVPTSVPPFSGGVHQE